MIERPRYQARLDRHRDNGLAKVLTGMRRTGKSTILRQFFKRLADEGTSSESIVSINLELADQAALRDGDALLSYVRQRHRPGQTTYVCLDEAQESPDVGRVVYALMEEGGYDLYLTGSHTRLVERQLSSLLAGRFVEITVHPLSFAEYCQAARRRGTHEHDASLFRRYLEQGGLPSSIALGADPYALHDYLDGVYHTVLRRDVSASLGKEDPLLLDAIVRQLMGSLGTPVSANGLSRALSASGRTCSDDTVARYLDALDESYVFHRVRRYDLRTNSLLKSQEKFYVTDLGLRTLALGTEGTGLQGLLENVVYLELRRRHDEVHVGKHYARHISFVAHDASGTTYYQVAPSVLDPHALKEALAPLQAERDNYPKTLLTLDEVGLASHQGILQKNVVDWLLE